MAPLFLEKKQADKEIKRLRAERLNSDVKIWHVRHSKVKQPNLAKLDIARKAFTNT